MPRPTPFPRVAPFVTLVALTVLSACHDKRPHETFSEPPAAVVASFQHFADSVTPQLYRLFDSAGMHPGWSDTSNGGRKLRVHVRQLTEAEAKAQIYEADLSLTFHTHVGKPSGLPMPENLFLEFTSIRDGKTWALLTDQGFPFTLVTESNRNDLPLDLELGVRGVFRTRAEFADWTAYRRAKLGNADGAAPMN